MLGNQTSLLLIRTFNPIALTYQKKIYKDSKYIVWFLMIRGLNDVSKQAKTNH